MLSAHPQAPLRVSAPWTVVRLICSNDVQVELYRSLQLPLEDQVMPAARKREAACEWVSLVTLISTGPDATEATGSFSFTGAPGPAAAVMPTRPRLATAATTTNERARLRIRVL